MWKLSTPRRMGRPLALIVAGVLAGSVLITPAAAHIGDTLGHLFSHADARYVRTIVADSFESSGTLTTNGDATISTVTISLPVSGLVVIQGSVVVNNNDTGAGEGDNIAMKVRVDGAIETVASHSVGPDVVAGLFDPEEVVTVSYVETRFLGVGPHTISQVLDAGGTGINLQFHDENFVVTFAPDGVAN